MQTDEKRTFKNQLYEQFARIGKALSSSYRLELLEVLAQREHSVEALAQETVQRQVSKAQTTWEHKCWHLSHRRFACEADARAAVERELKGNPGWLEVHRDLVAHPQYAGKGRPHKDASLTSHLRFHEKLVRIADIARIRLSVTAMQTSPILISIQP